MFTWRKRNSSCADAQRQAISTMNTPLSDYSHIELSYVTAFYFNEQNSDALSSLLKHYAGYPPDVLDRIQFVFVNDGSPVAVEIPLDLNLNLLVLRIDIDIPWNQPGARNLGMVCARSDKVLLSDLDHEFSSETLRTIIQMKPHSRTFYKMRRETADGKPYGPHPNTFVLSRARFLKLYGYDEDFCGHYGFDDAMFWRWQRYNGTRFRYLHRRCCACVRTLDLAHSYHSLQRDLTWNKSVAEQKRLAWKRFGPQAGHSRRFLCFPWSKALDLSRVPVPPKTTLRPLWVRTWWWRWLVGGP